MAPSLMHMLLREQPEAQVMKMGNKKTNKQTNNREIKIQIRAQKQLRIA